MTQEDKAKRYDELLLKLQKAKVDDNVCDEMYYRVIDDIVPELKESEDEKILRHLKAVVKEYDMWTERGLSMNDVLAWLEKQGEQKQDPCEHCADKRLNCHNFPCVKGRAFKQGKSVLEAIIDEKVDNANKVEPKDYNSIDHHFGHTTDKVKPEFKIGDFVVRKDNELFANGSLYARITDIKKEQYWFDSGTWLEAKYIRHWNISDAKDGDVLNSPSHHLIWIYKDNEHYYACVNMNYVTGNVATDGLISIPNDACPATKEQRNQLKKAMRKTIEEIKRRIKLCYI